MIPIHEVEHLHQTLINKFGGTPGIRDRVALESALARPFQTFDKKELYPSALEKAASLIESVLINHPFIDGNKRTGITLVLFFLFKSGLEVTASQDNTYEFVINIASGSL
ncbi:MAG: type II toxin-antitoxin system death-on-curing family toxin [Chitinophagaceae bacterium]|nr:type II toxin-antitoxin system death-on-curing family toxin [Chitinophagaceae bacterium]